MEKQTKKMGLEILEVGDRKEVGEKHIPKLEFKARYGSEELKFATFSKTLMEHIKVGAKFEADVEISEREYNGNHYIDRNVREIYLDGKPVHQARTFPQRGYSPENIQSIEAQTAFKGAIELIVAGKADKELESLANQWAKQRLGFPVPIKEAAGLKEKKTPSAAEKEVEEIDFNQTKYKRDPSTIKNVSGLWKACSEDFGLSPKGVQEILGVKSYTEIADVQDAYRKVAAKNG